MSELRIYILVLAAAGVLIVSATIIHIRYKMRLEQRVEQKLLKH